MKTLVQKVAVQSYSSKLESREMSLKIVDPIHGITSSVKFEGALTPEGAKYFYLNYLNRSNDALLVTWSVGEIVKLSSLDRIVYYEKINT